MLEVGTMLKHQNGILMKVKRIDEPKVFLEVVPFSDSIFYYDVMFYLDYIEKAIEVGDITFVK